MKIFYLLSSCLALLLTSLFPSSLLSQETVVGTLKNGKPVITSLVNATTVLKGGLSAGSTVTDVYIDQDPVSGKYFLLGMIRNSNVTGKAVELELEGGNLRAAAGGPGLEVTCIGENCSQCVPVITKAGVRCVCKDNPAQQGSSCDMSTKVILSIW
jgi:hypothetical protein